MKRAGILLLLLAVLTAGCAGRSSNGGGARVGELRIGYLANLTHAQVLLGLADGSLQEAVGVKVTTRVFSAGPSAITALFAGEIDVLYVGPSPAVNGYIRSGGKALKVVAGGASGGAVFVTKRGLDIHALSGSHLSSPGVANTQDVSLRHFLEQQGLRTWEQGGDVRLNPLAPADILTLFKQGHLDGAWVAEPWGARMVHEAGGVIAVDERDLWPDRRFATTVVVVSRPYLNANRDTVKRLLASHVAMTRWIGQHPDEAAVRLQTALASLQGKPMPMDILKEAMARVDFVYDPMVESVMEQAKRAYRLGFLGAREPDVGGLYDLTLLKEVAP